MKTNSVATENRISTHPRFADYPRPEVAGYLARLILQG